MNILIGNIIAFAACVVMLFDGYVRSRQKVLMIQIGEYALHSLAAVCVGAYSGAIVNVISVPRNILAYKNKLTTGWKAACICVTVVLTLWFNNHGWIGLLPIAASVGYILLMNKTQGVSFKVLNIGSVILWLIYDTYTKIYVSAVFDALFLIAACSAVFRIRRYGDPDI